MSTERKKDQFIIYLKVIAALLIINSHCRNIYPLYFFAIGGSFGNAIFFAVSGYCLAHISLPFGQWIKKRILRLMPAVVGIILISFIFGAVPNYSNATVCQYCEFFLNRYWFVFAIIIYYCIFFFVFKHKKSYLLRNVFIIYSIIYLIWYIFGIDKSTFSVELEGFAPFKVFFYFGIFVAGGWIRANKLRIKNYFKLKYIKSILIFCLMASFVAWVVVYAAIMVFAKAYSIQFLVHVAVFSFTVALMILAIFYEDILKEKQCNKCCSIIADSTLEIYLVQVTFQQSIETIFFPLSWVLIISISLIGGITYHIILKILYERMRKVYLVHK